MNGITVPGRVPVHVQLQSGPNAVPVYDGVSMPTGGLQIFAFGGLTKLEWATIQLAAAHIASPDPPPAAAEDVVGEAMNLLAACAAMEAQPPEDPPASD
jgi:hypothetical protein